MVKSTLQGFPGGSVDKNPPGIAEDMGLIPDPGSEKLPEVTVTTWGNPGFPAATREGSRDSPFSAS